MRSAEAPALAAGPASPGNVGSSHADVLASGQRAGPLSTVWRNHSLGLGVLAALGPRHHFAALGRCLARPLAAASLVHVLDVIGLRPGFKVIGVKAGSDVTAVSDYHPGSDGAVRQYIGRAVYRNVAVSPVPTPVARVRYISWPQPALVGRLASAVEPDQVGGKSWNISGGQALCGCGAFTRGARGLILSLGHRSVLSFGDKSARGVRALRVGDISKPWLPSDKVPGTLARWVMP